MAATTTSEENKTFVIVPGDRRAESPGHSASRCRRR
jgi:hypothetical protein